MILIINHHNFHDDWQISIPPPTPRTNGPNLPLTLFVVVHDSFIVIIIIIIIIIMVIIIIIIIIVLSSSLSSWSSSSSPASSCSSWSKMQFTLFGKVHDSFIVTNIMIIIIITVFIAINANFIIDSLHWFRTKSDFNMMDHPYQQEIEKTTGKNFFMESNWGIVQLVMYMYMYLYQKQIS